MNSSLLKAVVFLWLFASSSLVAAEKEGLSSIHTGESSFTQVAEPPEVARVRIPLKLTFFEQIIVKSEEGIRRLDYKALTPSKFNFKATINRANHFYVSDWHIETIPTKWDKASQQWEVDVKFYKRYGQDQELEEMVGSMPIRGRLVGENMLFTLEAQGRQRFKNKQGNPLLLVEINSASYEEKGSIATRETDMKGPQ